jgi:TonB family protein
VPPAQVQQQVERADRVAPAPQVPMIASPYSRRVAPATSPADWIRNDDYPAAAIRAGEQGTVRILLDIDASGAIANCEITGSSGSALLDARTCELMRQRASFVPALDLQGKPTASRYRQSFRWALPEDDRWQEPWMDVQPLRDVVPLNPWTIVWRIRVDPQGAVVRCTSEWRNAGSQPLVRPCTPEEHLTPQRLQELRGFSKDSFDVVFYIVQTVNGMPPPSLPDRPTGSMEYSRVTVAFGVDPAGKPTGCHETLRTGAGDVSDGICRWVHDFKPDAASKDRSASVTLGYYTSGRAPLVAPPAPPPPLAIHGKARPPRPVGSPQSWITADDYPAAASRAGDAGTARIKLEIDEQGAVSNCVVLQTSGSQLLDEASCTVLRQRAHFIPALDWKGRPVPSNWIQRINWSLPEEPKAPISSFGGITRMRVPAEGQTQCAVEAYGVSRELLLPCASLETFAGRIRLSPAMQLDKPATLIGYVDHRVAGVPSPPGFVVPTGFIVLGLDTLTYDLTADGKRQNCRIVKAEGPLAPTQDLCAAPQLKYAVPVQASAAVQAVVTHVELTIALLSDVPLPTQSFGSQ